MPESLTRRLRITFGDRIRVRFSDRSRTFQVEGKSHRGLTDYPIPNGLTGAQIKKLFDVAYDDLLRARDGYQLIMEVQPGTRMACPGKDCIMELRAPVNRTAEVACEYCKSRRLDGRYVVSYFDLESEAFMDRLRYLDPERGWRDASLRSTHQRNLKLSQGREDDAMSFIESVNLSEYNGIAGIPQFGYSGKTSAWEAAPGSPLAHD